MAPAWSGSHSQAVAALAHTLLIEAQSPLRFLNHAEAAYAAGDLPLAFKSFMLCLNICEKPGEGEEEISLKAWYGVKLVSLHTAVPAFLLDVKLTLPRPCCAQTSRALLSAGSSATSASGVALPRSAVLQEFDILSTKWLTKILSSPSKDLDSTLLAAVREGALSQETVAK